MFLGNLCFNVTMMTFMLELRNEFIMEEVVFNVILASLSEFPGKVYWEGESSGVGHGQRALISALGGRLGAGLYPHPNLKFLKC